MNNEKEFFVNDVEANVSEEEIVLAPPTELIEEAKEIEQNTKTDEKFPFDLQYDSNQKEFLLSMLETVGAVVEADDEEGCVLATMMNMTQLAFIKRLDAVERVKTDEGNNPFLAEEAEAAVPEASAELIAEPMQAAQVMTLAMENVAEANAEEGIAVACEDGTGSCCCPSNDSMATAQTISDESYTSGYSMLCELANRSSNTWYVNGGRVGFGLGCIQWSFSRTLNLVKAYREINNNSNSITTEQACHGEALLILRELGSSEYNSIISSWKTANTFSDSSSAASSAGRYLCNNYICPKDSTGSVASTRATRAAAICSAIAI